MQMKKFTLLTTVLASSALWVTAAAQQATLQADFESDAVTAGGWTEYHSGTKALWTVTKYSSEAQLKSPLSANKLGAAQCAVSRTGGLSVVGGVNPSNWLITPAVTVASGDYLNYQVAYGTGYNTSNVTSDDNRIRLDVLVSTTTADTTAFTDTLRCEIPREIADWSFRSLDLSKYAGKTVYIAFHDHGTPIKNFVSQNLFLDNVEVSQSAKVDQGVNKINAFSNGTLASQPVVARLVNYGAATNGYTVSYSVDGGEPVTQTVSLPVASGDTITHTFTLPANFEPGTHTVSAWTSASGDAYAYNDTVSTTVTIFETAPLPYKVTSANATSALASSYTYRSTGWAYMSNYSSWIYTPVSRASYLYTTKGVALKKGKVKVVANVTSTADNATLTAYLTTTKDKYDSIKAGSTTLVKSLNPSYQNFIIDVPEDGNYIIGLAASATGQIAISELTYQEPYEDLQLKAVTAPASAQLAQAGVPVAVKVYNDGLKTQSAVKVAYQVDDAAVVEEQLDSIQPATSADYTFKTTADLSKAGNHTIKAWVHIDDDGDASNDTVSYNVYAYAAHQFPYATSFETTADSLEWTNVNLDGDAAYWGVESTPTYGIDGSHTLYLNFVQSVKHNDYAVSPAIAINGGQRGRVSFYYGLTSNSGSNNLQIIMAKDPSAEGLAKGTVLGNIAITQKGYSYANAYFNIPDTAAGNYYFAIYANGGYDQIFVDDFRVDAANELAVVGVASSVTGSSYDPADADITVALANYGVGSLSGAKLTCTIVGADESGKVVSTQTLTDTYTGTVESGDTVQYTLKDKASFTEAGTYVIAVAMTCDGDADSKNNSYQTDGPVKWTTLSVPVTIGFENTNDNKAIQVASKWTVSSYVPYQGTRSFAHSGAAANATGDWAFLNRIHIPAGTYDVSFFWKTMTGNTKDTYKQNFAVYLGKEANADAMTIKVAELSDTLNADHKANKELATITIPEDGNYYIGTKCTTTNSLGYLVLDQFTVAAPAQGIAVTADSAYTADFATRESEWYHYHPTSTSNQWKATTSGDETVVSADRTYTSWMQTWKTPGLYEAPAFSLEAGKKYEASFSYAIAGTDASNPLDGESRLDLLLASVDKPDAFDVAVASGTETYIASGASRDTVAGTFTVPQDGVYYLAFLPDSKVSARFSIYSFDLKCVESTGVISNVAGTQVTVKRDRVEITGPYNKCTVYTVGGVAVASAQGQSVVSLESLSSGAYLVQVTLPNGKQIVKKVALTH